MVHAANTLCQQQAYLDQLESNPLRTKMLTSGTLAGAQELIASWLAKDRNKHGNYFTSRVPKMAAYGALVSAPLGHFLIWLLQKTFKGRTSLKAKILQILVSNLIVCLPRLVSSTFYCPLTRVLTSHNVDRAHPEQRLPRGHGPHRRCPDVPPGAGDRPCRFLEGDARQLDH